MKVGECFGPLTGATHYYQVQFGDKSRGIEEDCKEISKILLWRASAKLPLSAVILVHGVDSIKDKLFADLLIVHD